MREPNFSSRSAGIERDRALRASRQPAPVAVTANGVNAAPTKPSIGPDDKFALVLESLAPMASATAPPTPVSISSLLTMLEATYVLTPQP